MFLKFLNYYFTILGGGWLLVDIINKTIYKQNEISTDLIWVLLLTLFVTIIYFLFDGFKISGFLLSKVKIKNKFNETEVEIRFADIFKEKGWKVVSVNDFFDSRVNNKNVSEHSLHGAMLTKYWAGNTKD